MIARAIIVGSSVIQCTDVVRDLGVLLDSELSMQRHIGKVTDSHEETAVALLGPVANNWRH